MFFNRLIFFFIQERIGLDRQVFKFIKFSSMINNNNQDNLIKYESYRINKYGRFIRKLHFDEIPQIFNILKGEMNLFGPRPWSKEHDKIYRELLSDRPYFLDKYYKRFSIKPGIIGLSQINNFDDETVNSLIKRIIYDSYYIKHQDFALNVYIFFFTIIKILKKSINL